MDSKNIVATNARLDSLFGGFIDKKIDNRNIEEMVNQKVEESKIKTGIITKYYPYLDKAEVKLDFSGELIVCKILHRYGGDIIDFYTPLAHEETYCEKLNEPCIIPKAENCVCVLQTRDRDSKENIIIGYYHNDDIIGYNPASPGNIKLMCISEDNQFWIKFGRDGLDYRGVSSPTMKVGDIQEDMQEINNVDINDVYVKSEIDNLLLGYEQRIKALEDLMLQIQNDNNNDNEDLENG